MFRALAASAIALASLGIAGPAAAEERKVNVVELFTSQGCSSCPPANANLIELRSRPDVLALSFSVTYWDRLGWKDVFGQEKFTDRQRIYEPALGERGPFTPQMVINGRTSLVGHYLPEVETALAAATPGDVPAISIGAGKVAISAGESGREADVWVAFYEADVLSVDVKRGENTGRTLSHSNVVRDLVKVGAWSGDAVEFSLPAAAQGLKTAVLVQEPSGGPILSAATD